MVTIYLARHGETEENIRQILQGWIGGHLSTLGKQQAQELRDKLCGIHFDAFFCSDLKRACDTALIVNESVGLPIQKTAMLRERDWGELTGVSMKEAQALPLLPPTVETVEATCRRAANFLKEMLEKYDGKQILVVSHGFFARCMQAVWLGVSFRQVPLMTNAEYRILKVEKVLPPVLSDCNSTVISAN